MERKVTNNNRSSTSLRKRASSGWPRIKTTPGRWWAGSGPSTLPSWRILDEATPTFFLFSLATKSLGRLGSIQMVTKDGKRRTFNLGHLGNDDIHNTHTHVAEKRELALAAMAT